MINYYTWNQLNSYTLAYHNNIVGNFQERKPSWILQFYSHPWKFSPRNFRHATPIYAISLTFHKMFPSLLIRESFLPRKFPVICYMHTKRKKYYYDNHNIICVGRWICCTYLYCSYGPPSWSLGWLIVFQHYDFKILHNASVVYNAVPPVYLDNML